MMNRISNRLIARFVAFAALLALVMAAPAVFAQDSEIDYAENGTEPVANFSATDADGDPIVFSLSGSDAAKFEISDDGALSFKSSPNFESPGDADSDNVYMVTVNAARGSTTVAITVTNVDEPGKVTINDLQPQAGAGQSVTAGVTDPDGSPVSTTWQWSRSMDMSSWEDISGATAAAYTPQEEDDGYYLRATAEYSDGVGAERDSASAESLFPVEIRPPANFSPSFAVQDEKADETGIQVTRSVSETAKVGATIGNAVVATDADNDPLLYTLVDYDDPDQGDTDGTEVAEVDDGQWFKIDTKTGQITATTPSNQKALTDVLQQDQNADTTVTPNLPRTEFEVSVIATDPSGATATVKVTIKIAKVDEAPTIAAAPDLADGVSITATEDAFNVKTDEEVQLDPSGIGSDTALAPTLPIFEATDPEGMLDASTLSDERIVWSLSGPDAGRFDIVKLPDASNDGKVKGALRFTTPYPSFEAMDSADGDNVYVVVVTASDGAARSSKAVSVTVENVEEPGSISLSQRRPQEGIPITARLTDKDGNISGTEWQWYRGGVPAAGVITIPAGVADCAADNVASSDSAGTRNVCRIPDGTSATYVPTGADATNYLTVTASYVDGFKTLASDTDSSDAGDLVIKTSEHAAEPRPTSNTAPRFLNKGPEEREVAENVKGASVGDPVAGIDSDPLIHKLSGDDADAFEIDNSGQITTAKKLDYETKSSYTVTVTATDPSLSSASIVVNITVTDADDAGTVILLTGNAPAFAADEMTRSVAENTAAGMAIGDPVAATDEDGDALTYTLGGDDADSFAIDAATGQLTTSAALDYETKMSYTVTVTASSGKADEMDATTTVTIMVTDEGLANAYDLNEDGAIERDEVIAAIQDYLAGNIARSEVTALISLYFENGG
jgi:hypothetical protein